MWEIWLGLGGEVVGLETECREEAEGSKLKKSVTSYLGI